MKKIIITLVCIVLFTLILTIVIVNFSSSDYKKTLNKVETTFRKNNKDVEDIGIEIYYSDKTYYIVQYKEENIEYVSVLNEDIDKLITHKKEELSKQKKNYIIGYKYDKLIYEYKKTIKGGFVYSYYDALTGEFINDIKLTK